MVNYTLKIVQIRQETADSLTLCFKQPALKKIKYKAGQYLSLIFRINGRRYIRPYSFSSCPNVDSFLEVTVKRVPKGIVSNHIHDQLKEGDSVEVMSPMGDFIYENVEPSKQVFLWGVGSGITPLISIAKHVLHNEENVKVHLAYGNRNPEGTIFLTSISQLQSQYPANFEVKHFHTQPSLTAQLPEVIQGRINREKVMDIIGEVDFLNSIHYICGPIGLKESIKEVLQALKVPESSIFSEDFELIKDPKLFEDIHTQDIRINFNGEDLKLEVIKGKSILEAGLDANIELAYSCQTGNCSTCKGNLLAGEVKMIGLNKERMDLQTNEYLLCCTYPLTENVYIEIR